MSHVQFAEKHLEIVVGQLCDVCSQRDHIEAEIRKHGPRQHLVDQREAVIADYEYTKAKLNGARAALKAARAAAAAA